MNGLVGKTKDSFEKQRKLLYTLINALVRQEKWKNVPLKIISANSEISNVTTDKYEFTWVYILSGNLVP